MMTYGDYAAAISIIVIAVPGLFGNVNILAAILRKKDLRTKSGCLMCLVAFYDCISILFEIVTAKRLFCGEILPKRDCFASVVPYFIILVTQSYTLLALAVDRMIAIFYPMKYRQMSMTFSLLLSCLPGILIGSVLAVLAFVYMDDDTVAFCNPPMALPSKIEEIYRSYTVAVNICIISLYAISLYGIHRQKKLLHTIHDARHSRHVLQQQQTMRTIGVILMVFVAAYFVVQLVNFVIIYAQIDESLPAIEFIRGMSVVPIMITFSQSFYVYWWRSREYRTVFKEQLKYVFRCLPWGKRSATVRSSTRTVFHVSHIS